MISKAALPLDLRLVFLVVGSLTSGFSRAWIGLLGFSGWRITLFLIRSSILSGCFPMTPIQWLV